MLVTGLFTLLLALCSRCGHCLSTDVPRPAACRREHRVYPGSHLHQRHRHRHYGGTDRVYLAPSRGRHADRRGLPQDGDLGADVLSLEKEICRDGRSRDSAAEARSTRNCTSAGRRTWSGSCCRSLSWTNRRALRMRGGPPGFFHIWQFI